MSLFPFDHKSGLLIKANCKDVAASFIKWANEPLVEWEPVATTSKSGLYDAFQFVDLVRSAIPFRAVVVSYDDKWSVYFDNDLFQDEPQAICYVLCERLRVDTCFMFYDHEPSSENYRSCSFTFSSRSNSDEVIQRKLILLKETKWKFLQAGEVLYFEDTSLYMQRKIDKRLNDQILKLYGQRMGYHFWDENRYGQEVIFLSWKDWNKR